MGKISTADVERLQIDRRVAAIHQRSVVIDLHVDSVLQNRLFGYDVCAHHDPSQRITRRSLPFDGLRAWMRTRGRHQPLYNHADIPRMRRGGYNAVAFGLHYWPIQTEAAFREILRQLDYVDQIVSRSPDLVHAKTPGDLRRAAASEKLAVFTGVEGVHCLGKGGKETENRRLDRIEHLHERGVRYITLAHFSANDAATHCYGIGSNDSVGLSDFGGRVVEKMNRIGMLIDVSHVSDAGVIDACRMSRAPVIATHTGCRGKHPSPRNLSDEAIVSIARGGGTIGFLLAPYFLNGRRADSSCVVSHMRYATNLLDAAGANGVQHIGIGSDFDGWIQSIPDDMLDCADMPLLTRSMLNDGFTKDDIHRIYGENFLRTWQHAVDVA